MRRIKTFALFEAGRSKDLTKKQTDFLDRYTAGKWKFKKATGMVDVEGDFVITNRGLKEFYGIRFGKVSGNFDCHGNNLTSLQGAPKEVGGNFGCPKNRISSLEGAPKKVGGDFVCSHNQLTTLEGAPEMVGGIFNCNHNELITLVGAPKEVGKSFNCQGNQLTTLEGAPEKTGDYFMCSHNPLTSLKGAPKKVGNVFDSGGFFLYRQNYNLEGILISIENSKTEEGKKLAISLLESILSDDEIADVIRSSHHNIKYINILKEIGLWDRIKPLLGTGADQTEDLADLGF